MSRREDLEQAIAAMSARTRYRRRRAPRSLPVLAIILVAVILGGILATSGGSHYGRHVADRFVSAWAKHDYAAMYAEIDAQARQRVSQTQFATAYEDALRTATATATRVAGKVREVAGEAVLAPVAVATRVFGTLHLSFAIHFAGKGSATRIAWTNALAFPGLRAGARLTRHTTLPQRAALLTREGSVLASGPAEAAGERYSPLGGAASSVVGSIGPIPAGEREALEAEGVPRKAIVGVDGLERTFDSRLRGRPGGTLLEGGRVIASAQAKASPPVRTTISGPLQVATVKDIGAHYGGAVAIDPRTGDVLAVAGIGLDGLQPPGSTFKMVTVTGILESGIAKPETYFPYKTEAVIEGVKLHNAASESCGGTLILSFAVSCNSVFSPLGVKLGAARLVRTAEHYGFNHQPDIPGAAASTIPQPQDIRGELALGSSSIGQGEVLSTPLEMATIAATIADGGIRHEPNELFGEVGKPTRVSSPQIADEVRTMMIHVVLEGTGNPTARIPGVVVAGKTGTAELGTPTGCSSEASAAGSGSASGSGAASGSGCSATNEKENTDGWFAAFAPAEHPKLAVGVLMVRDGYGAESAAPVAKEILEAAIG
ncbi:MAG: penicillin-binding transpeptidase domain-containing protein [Solirubrobacteraceae bacterium]